GRTACVVALSLASASVARFFGGGLPEIAVGAIAGLLLGLLSLVVARQLNSAHVYEIVAALVAAGVAYLAPHAGIPSSVAIATLAGVITLVPGLTLTLAMAELATRNLLAGTSRLTAPAIVFPV